MALNLKSKISFQKALTSVPLRGILMVVKAIQCAANERSQEPMKFRLHNKPYEASCVLPTIDGRFPISVTAFYSSAAKSYSLLVERADWCCTYDMQKVSRRSEKSFDLFLKQPALLERVAEACWEWSLSLPLEWLKNKMTLGFYLPALKEPSYFFKVGDSVSIGNLQNAVVTKVYEGGKIYQIESGSEEARSSAIEFWHSLRPATEGDTSFTQNEDLRISFQNRTVYSILHAYYSGGIDMNPSYQRELVWDEADKVALIDSIFHQVDIGKFVMVSLPYAPGGAWVEILDGKQRLNALVEFYENRFPYKGKFYNELHWRDRVHFEGYSIAWADCPEMSENQKLRYFLMLNTGGRAVSAEHLDKIRDMVVKED